MSTMALTTFLRRGTTAAALAAALLAPAAARAQAAFFVGYAPGCPSMSCTTLRFDILNTTAGTLQQKCSINIGMSSTCSASTS